jgi:hypothetical protein
MKRQLVHLDRSDVDRVITIKSDGAVVADTSAISALIARALGVLGAEVAIASLDYLQAEGGTPEPDTRTASGIWWHSKGDDTALIGGFVIEGHAMTITTEGEGESPIAESAVVISRATRAIASQYEGAEIVDTGLFKFMAPTEEKLARVVVTRDYRVRRPHDILDPNEFEAFAEGSLGFAIVQVIGGEKALVIKHGV